MKKHIAAFLPYSALFLGFLLLSINIEAQDKPRKYVYPRRPEEPLKVEVNQVYYDLAKGSDNVDWSRLDGTLEYIKNEYDCSDFRLVNLTRILYEYGDRIPTDYLEKIKGVLFDFRFWWDDPGENSMCYWSENHQILFAAAEYLLGQKYPEQLFINSGLTGKEHMEKARTRMMDWFEMRWNYGFIEYYSSVYYKEDIGPLINLIDFAEDDEIVMKAKIMMDLLFYDVAAQSMGLMFSSVSGRAYERNRKGGNESGFDDLVNFYWGDGKEIGPGIMYGMMVSDNYSPPPVIKSIALDSSTMVIKQSNGLNLSEVKDEGYYGADNRSMMMQWGMEAFTNPIIIRNSLKHIRNTRMFSNDFVSDFRMMNIFLLRWLHLEPTVSRILNPQYNGVAIQKGNTYTYKTPDYSMYTVQNHQPGDYADQQHIFGVNMKDHFSVFHNHPAREKESKASSPNYWVGYGHFPHSVQDKNVNLSIYSIPRKKGIMESALLDYTRAWFPSEKFDEAFITGNYAFGKKGDTYIAMITSDSLKFRDAAKDDIILPGKKSFWITEVSSASEDESFEIFQQRIRKNKVVFNRKKLELIYHSRGSKYELKFGKDFIVNNEVIDTNYSRYDSPFAKAEKKDETITIKHKGEKLFLDMKNLIRNY